MRLSFPTFFFFKFLFPKTFSRNATPETSGPKVRIKTSKPKPIPAQLSWVAPGI